MQFDPHPQTSVNNRRRWIVQSLSMVATTSVASGIIPSLWTQAESNPSRIDSESKTYTTLVKSVLELEGKVRLRNFREKTADNIKTASLKAKSDLEYEEQFKLGNDRTEPFCASIQKFTAAKSNNQIDSNTTELTLRETCHEVFKRSSSLEDTMTCLQAPLTQAERDLVKGPVSTMFLELLLPTSKIKLGDSWSLTKEACAKLMNLDMVTEGGLRITLIEADEKTGKLEINGQLKGEVHYVATSLKVQGKAHVNRVTGIVSWLAMVIEEDRDISESEPGFSVTARLRILREAIGEMSSGITVEEVENIASKSQSLDLVQIESIRGAYRFVADKGWSTYSDTGVDASLRLTQKNRTTATCTITNLTDTEPGTQLTIEGFQNDIQRSLGTQFVQFLEASESVTQNSLRMMRVVAMGKIQDVPIHWIHVLLSNDAGRHITLVYTLDAEAAERFDAHDMQMAGTFEFTLKQLPKLPSEKQEGLGMAKSLRRTLTSPPNRLVAMPVTPMAFPNHGRLTTANLSRSCIV